MIFALLLNVLLLAATVTNKLVAASDIVPKIQQQQQQQPHNYFRHTNNQPRELLPWDMHFIKGSSKGTYNDRKKQVSFDFTRTAVRKDIIVKVYEQGCDSIIYPIPGDDDNSMMSNIVITDGVEMPPSNNDDNDNPHSSDEVTFKAIVEFNDDVQSSPLFYIHDNGTATIDFCLHLALTTGDKEVDGNTDVVMFTERVDFKWKFAKVQHSNKYINIASLTGKAALTSEL